MDSLIHNVQSLTLEEAPKLVYMDVLNFAMYFFKIRDHWSFQQAELKVHKLVASAKASNVRLKVFIDAFIQSEESIRKWRKRRENEVLRSIRNVPQGLNVLLGEMFAAEGVEVCYSVDADNDDTLASHAHHDNASVLSQDKDFLRYIGATYTIYTEFKVSKKGLLILTKRTDMVLKPSVSMLDIKEKPATRDCNPGVTSLPASYLRGSPSPLTKQCGNLHLTIRPLRQAYYASLGLKAGVREEFPVFRDGRVIWDVSENVEPDEFLIELLRDPVAAYAYFFKKLKKPRDVSYENWSNHVYATYSIVFEMCGLYLNESLLSLLHKHAVKP